MENEVNRTTLQEDKGSNKRVIAAKALAVFIILIIVLTWASLMLEDMTIATVVTTTVQRGALEKQIRQSGTLEAAHTVPVVLEDSARVLDIYGKVGGVVAIGDPLFVLSFTDIVKEKYEAFDNAQQNEATAQRALDWAAASIGETAVSRISTMMALEATYYAEMDAQENNENAMRGEAYRFTKLENSYEAEKRKMDADESVYDYILKLEEATRATKALQEQSDAFLSLMQTIDGFAEVGSIEEALSLYTPGIACTRTYYAPVSGTVLECSLDVGFVAQTVSPAMALSDQASGTMLTVVVSSNDAGEMAVGDTVQLSVGSERYDSAVSSIVNSVKTPGMAAVEITLPKGSGVPGMNAEMLFTKRTQNYDVIVPLSALRHDNNGDFIFIVRLEEGSLGVKLSVRRVDVYVLDQSSGRVAIQGDITQRDLIVVRGDRSLMDGDRIRISEGL